MRVAIVGSRELPSYTPVVRFVSKLAEKYPDAVVVSGGARGVDTYAELQAKNLGLSVLSFRPVECFYADTAGPTKGESGRAFFVERVEDDELRGHVCDADGDPIRFPSYGRAAFARNEWIVREADVVVAFWDGESRGTKNSIDHARRLGKRVFVNP